MKVIAQNKKAYYDCDIQDRLEVGIVLRGDEVKSVRAGHVNLTGSFAHVKDGELFLVNCHISPYSHAYVKADESNRTRKLLLHRRELMRLVGEISRSGVVLIPLKIYLNNKGRVKLELGVGKHKKAHERKEEIRERDIQRETRRELKDNYRY
jgi:SsrA-binding protein